MAGAIEKYNVRAEKANSLVCIGLDSDFEKIPERFKAAEFPQFEFNKYIIEATHEYASAYKPNTAFYEAQGDRGMRELRMTMGYVQVMHPDILTVCDAKRADIASASKQYARAIFEWFGFDAVTLNPYLGKDALEPFLDYKDKGCIILCHTSNPGAEEFQEQEIDGKPFWELVTQKVVKEWNTNGNCMLLMGATYPEEMRKARELAPDLTFLVAGIDTQGGKTKEVIEAGLDAQKNGLMINSSRGIIFAENSGKVAKSLRDEINKWRI